MYCDQAAFSARFSSGEKDELLPGTDGRDYASAAADADALIDAYLAARYSVPLAAPVPPIIIGIAADLTRYGLYEDAPPKEVAKRRKLAIGLLELLRDGEMLIPGATLADSAAIAVSAREQIFTEDLGDTYVGAM